MDTTQVLLVIVITALTILLVAVGIQVFFILREVRDSIRKLNKILDDAGEVSGAITRPIASLSDSLTGLSGVSGILSWLTNKKKDKASVKNG